jgi:hypothetical protein
MVARYPRLPSCLTATEEGSWLYASAGYRTVGLAWPPGGGNARRVTGLVLARRHIYVY